MLFILKFRFLVLDSATEMFFMFFLSVQSNIIIVEIDQRSLFVRSKEVILSVIVGPFEGFDRVVVEGWRAKVCRTGMTCFEKFLEEQVVSCGDVVVLIGFDTSFGIFDIKVELSQFFQYFLIHWDSMVSNDDSAIQRNVLHLIAPLVLVYLLNPIPFARIYVQDLLQEIFERVAHEVRKDVLSRENFFIELRSVTVLER